MPENTLKAQRSTSTTPMNRPTTIKLPTIDIAAASAASPVVGSARGRPRSASIVKVEEVGHGSLEEVLDRSAYVNINADWVNAKGQCPGAFKSTTFIPPLCRRLAHPRRPDLLRQGCHRHHSWNDPTNKLDPG